MGLFVLFSSNAIQIHQRRKWENQVRTKFREFWARLENVQKAKGLAEDCERPPQDPNLSAIAVEKGEKSVQFQSKIKMQESEGLTDSAVRTASNKKIIEGAPEILQPKRNSNRLAAKWNAKQGALTLAEFMEQRGTKPAASRKHFWQLTFVKQKIQDLIANKVSWCEAANQLGVPMHMLKNRMSRRGLRIAKTSPEAERRLLALSRQAQKKKVREDEIYPKREEEAPTEPPALSPLELIQRRNIEEQRRMMIQLGLIKETPRTTMGVAGRTKRTPQTAPKTRHERPLEPEDRRRSPRVRKVRSQVSLWILRTPVSNTLQAI